MAHAPPYRFRLGESIMSGRDSFSHLLALFQEVIYFWWKNQSASVVALYKFHNYLGGSLWQVFLKEMARSRENLELKLS